MKKVSVAGLSVLIFLAVIIQLFYSSCNKDSCENFICWNGGTCTNGSCVCATGWKGDICTTPDSASIDLCANVVCQNGGTCVNGTCNCVAGYEGANCEIETRSKYLRTWNTNQN